MQLAPFADKFFFGAFREISPEIGAFRAGFLAAASLEASFRRKEAQQASPFSDTEIFTWKSGFPSPSKIDFFSGRCFLGPS